MRHLIFCSVLALSAPAAILAAQTTHRHDNRGPELIASTFSVSSPTQIPNAVLKPGAYKIRVIDRVSDRMVLRIDDDNNNIVQTFLGVPSSEFRNISSSGPIAWAKPEHEHALRAYTFPGRFTVDFVYPKDEAVKLAQANGQPLQAIDLASEDLPSNLKKLSEEDLQIIILWTLTPTTVGPDGKTPAIEAQKYQPPASSEPVTVASNEPPPNPAASAAAGTSIPGSSARKPRIARLPHTASYLPLVLLAGLLSLLAIAALRLERVYSRAR